MNLVLLRQPAHPDYPLPTPAHPRDPPARMPTGAVLTGQSTTTTVVNVGLVQVAPGVADVATELLRAREVPCGGALTLGEHRVFVVPDGADSLNWPSQATYLTGQWTLSAVELRNWLTAPMVLWAVLSALTSRPRPSQPGYGTTALSCGTFGTFAVRPVPHPGAPGPHEGAPEPATVPPGERLPVRVPADGLVHIARVHQRLPRRRTSPADSSPRALGPSPWAGAGRPCSAWQDSR